MDLISVIIPVYNVEKYLDTCVESVVGQTYKNLEIILVDDGSTDNCPAMCDTWASRDPRVKVIHKQNGGLSSARNAGLKTARGDFVGFVDSDDVVSADMYEKLFSVLIKNNADIAQCGYFIFSDYSQIFAFNSNKSASERVFNSHSAVKSLITDGMISVICCSKLYKKKAIKSVFFEEGVINEDVLWTYQVLAKSDTIAATSEKLYGYFQREGSIMNSAYSERRFDALYALEKRANAVKTDFPDLFPFAERAYAGGCMYHYQWLCRLEDTAEFRVFRERLHKMFVTADLKSVFSVTDLKYKIWYTTFKYFPSFTCKIRNLLKIGL